MKYQFCIRFTNTTVNSAATKAVLDCNTMFFEQGYKDYTLTVPDNTNRLKYYIRLIKEIAVFFNALTKGAIVGIQYPLLSINGVFKYFIKLARLKGVKFLCIVHDLESLRTGGKDKVSIDKEIQNLNYFDCVIAHNEDMINWLTANGLNTKTLPLHIFDYLSTGTKQVVNNLPVHQTIAFAGNLKKSLFIYGLNEIKAWNFNVYGPNYITEKSKDQPNVIWAGEYSPEEIVHRLLGTFGLIWDGVSIEFCDEILGNYLRYNNPHKFSLYIAAGLPVIAPKTSAIAKFITRHDIGYLIDSLSDIGKLNFDETRLQTMKNNVMAIRNKVIKGEYFTEAITLAEETLIH